MIKIRAQIPIDSKGVILHIILIILVVRTGFEPVSSHHQDGELLPFKITAQYYFSNLGFISTTYTIKNKRGIPIIHPVNIIKTQHEPNLLTYYHLSRSKELE